MDNSCSIRDNSCSKIKVLGGITSSLFPLTSYLLPLPSSIFHLTSSILQLTSFRHRIGHYAPHFSSNSCQNTEIPQRWYVRREREKTSERGVFSTFWGLLEENMDTFCAFSELRHGRTAGLVMSYFICLSEILIVCRYCPLSQISNLN